MAVFFASELEGSAGFWRILRRDGLALGFTSHDRDLWFDGLLHRAAPGMLPSAIVFTAGLGDDSAEVEGALSHEAISAADLQAGRFDGATIMLGVVDWESLEREVLYRGTVGDIGHHGAQFTAALISAKAALDVDPVPRTSPTCRAEFCGPGCNLSASRFSREAEIVGIDRAANSVAISGAADHADLLGGTLRWVDGADAGIRCNVIGAAGGQLVLDRAIAETTLAGAKVLLTEGCDHTLATCASRFGNAANFRGEPFLPGNDLIARHAPYQQ